MTRPKYYKTEAIVLRHIPWGEADLILTILTPNLGKLRAVAKGARRSRSRMVGHLEPLTRVSLSLTTGRGMDRVTGAQALDSHRYLRESLDLSSCALYCVELVDSFAPDEEPLTPVYHLLRRSLEELATWPAEVLLRYFEFRLLGLVGYLPELYHCVSCRSAVSPEGHAFAPALGGVLCPACYNAQGRVLPLSVASLKVLRYFHRGQPQDVARLSLPPVVAAELERVLSSSITVVLEREVNSARFLYRLRQLQVQVAATHPETPTPTPSG